MTPTETIILILLFFATSIVGVVTGSNSLITVPVMFQFGISPEVAVATNMFGLTFMNAGAAIPFFRQKMVDLDRLKPLIAVTLVASAIGAGLVVLIEPRNIKLIVFAAMVSVTLFTLLRRHAGIVPDAEVSSRAVAVTYVLTFVLGIYGGLYSGGYVTMLTAVYVAFFGMKFSESVAATKVVNLFSSAIATAVFMWQGLVDYRLGLILAATMFAGAYIGARTAARLSEIWLRRIFVTVVLLLAGKTLFDFLRS
jgi:hypothetical protein